MYRSFGSMMDQQTPLAPLMQRRQQVLSPGYFHHYDEPVHAVRAKGVTIWDEGGTPYLDCYNNVPSVGHCHPDVVAALTKQASLINSHSRYLDETIVRYAERLVATLPPELDTCAFVCTGTEANALAYDMARTVTGNTGVLVSEGSYHGNALAVRDFSLYEGMSPQKPDFVRSLPVPHCGKPEYAAAKYGSSAAQRATPIVDELAASRHGVAMWIVDPIFDAPGIFTAPMGYLAAMSETVRDAGGLVVVDEVQAGLARLGDNIWGFEDSEIVPDIVTMGKPMGAGYPLAVVASTREIFSAFAEKRHYFNTFGGTPVAGAVGNAVLDVIEQDGILENVHTVGRHLKAGLDDLSDEFDCIDRIRGKGLFLGVPLIEGKTNDRPDPASATKLVNQMKRRGVLISACGASGNVLKIRPPLVFSHDNANQLLDTLRKCLSGIHETRQ